MSKFAEKVDLNKVGIIRLDEVGAYAVLANRELHEKGRAGRFAVANTKEQWVDSVHLSRAQALATSHELSAK